MTLRQGYARAHPRAMAPHRDQPGPGAHLPQQRAHPAQAVPTAASRPRTLPTATGRIRAGWPRTVGPFAFPAARAPRGGSRHSSRPSVPFHRAYPDGPRRRIRI
jgi:hypothetical protein